MRNRTFKFTLGFVIVGLVIFTLVIFAQRNAILTYQQNLPYARLSDQVENQVLYARLWLDQLKGGDKTINFDSDVLGQLSRTKNLLEGMYDGKETEAGTFKKATDEEARALLKETIYNIQNLADISQLRWNSKTEIITPATDSTAAVYDTKSVEVLNLQLDGSFRNFQTSATRFTEYINQHLTSTASSINVFSWVAVLGLASSFVAGSILYYRRSEEHT